VAQLPERSGEDRALVYETGIVVLDGASSHEPGTPSATGYVDCLIRHLAAGARSVADLSTVLATAIRSTADELDLVSPVRPSSTVAVVRVTADAVEVLVLGDTTVAVGTIDGRCEIVVDDRLNNLDTAQHSVYRRRLAQGYGYDDVHRALLRELQRQQRSRRNLHDGYWIAEADPAAAAHAITARYPRHMIEWVVVATDGARDTFEMLGVGWYDIATLSSGDLRRLLRRCHDWEADTDPDGRSLPRAKRHDDKTIAVLRF
jgi:hypothetical protein